MAADAACAMLEGVGVRCWIAPRDIRPGGEYGAAIIDAIDHCSVMVLIFSSSANDSTQIHREIERAVAKGVPIVPVRIEEVVPTKSMEFFLGAIHWLDALTPPIEKHLEQLAETLTATRKPKLQLTAGHSMASRMNRGRSKKSTVSCGAKRLIEVLNSAGGSTFIKSARVKWVLRTLVIGTCAALFAGGIWLYHVLQSSPAAVPKGSHLHKEVEVLVPEMVPFITDSERALIRTTYLPAPEHKALAVSTQSSFVTGQKNDEIAETAALEACKRRSGSDAKYCQLYAVGSAVIFTGGRPPMPPEPWVIDDPSIQKPLVAKDIPLIHEDQRALIEKNFPSARHPKALSIAHGHFAYRSGQSYTDEAVRRSLEWCGFIAGVSCMVGAINDVFVIPIPTIMKPSEFFRASTNAAIAAEFRADMARRLANATSGWNAVAVGANGHPGLGLRAATEQNAIEVALAECNRQDRNCRVIGIGPFSVEPLPSPAPQ